MNQFFNLLIFLNCFFFLTLITADLKGPINDLDQDFLESPVSDGTIEENFEAELVNAPTVCIEMFSGLITYRTIKL